MIVRLIILKHQQEVNPAGGWHERSEGNIRIWFQLREQELRGCDGLRVPGWWHVAVADVWPPFPLTAICPHRAVGGCGEEKGFFLFLVETLKRTEEELWNEPDIWFCLRRGGFSQLCGPGGFQRDQDKPVRRTCLKSISCLGPAVTTRVFLGPHSGHSAGVGDGFKKPHGGEEARAARICVQTWLLKTHFYCLNAESAFTTFYYFIFLYILHFS